MYHFLYFVNIVYNECLLKTNRRSERALDCLGDYAALTAAKLILCSTYPSRSASLLCECLIKEHRTWGRSPQRLLVIVLMERWEILISRVGEITSSTFH